MTPRSGRDTLERPRDGDLLPPRSRPRTAATHLPEAAREVVDSPGRVLDADTRTMMEWHFDRIGVGPRPGPAATSAHAPGQRPKRDEAEASRVAGMISDRTSGKPARQPRAFDFAAVRIHADAAAAESARTLSARAYTAGNHIVFGAGEYRPQSDAGRVLLAHELTHTVQQGDPARSAHGAAVQRVGIFESIARFFGGGTFPDEELQEYLTQLRENRDIEDNFDSDNKAREVVRRWKRRDTGFEILTVPIRILLIREMAFGFLSGDDQRGILDLLEESIPSELSTILQEVDVAALRPRFDGALRIRLTELVSQQEFEELSLFAGDWTLAGVQQVLHRHGDEHIIRTILDRGLRIIRFDTAFDRWRYDDGREEEVELTGLRGNRRGSEIRLRRSLSNERAASTLFHEVSHYSSAQPDRLEQEIEIRVAQEEFNIRHGLPPVAPDYRNPDGTVNEAEIRREIESSPHYNPVGRTRIGRRYEGETEVTGWSLP